MPAAMPTVRASRRLPHGRRGFTLIEMIVVVVLLSISMGVFLGYNYNQRSTFRLKSGARQASALFLTAREFAIVDGVENPCVYDPKSRRLGESLRDKSFTLPEEVRIRPPEEASQPEEPFVVAVYYPDGTADLAVVDLYVEDKVMRISIDPVLGDTAITRPDPDEIDIPETAPDQDSSQELSQELGQYSGEESAANVV